VLDDVRREPVAFVHRMKRLHASMLAHSTLTCQNRTESEGEALTN
jgi:hypothetical protein